VGELACAPNARNNRDLDITISYAAPNSPPTRVEYKMCALVLCLRTTLTGCRS
jgi:protein arginine N-methyltransferase 1